MTDFFERSTAHSANWSLNLSRFAALLLVLSIMGHRAELIDTQSFLYLVGIVGLLIVFSLLLGLRGFYRVWEHGDLGGQSLSRSAFYCVLVLVPLGIAVWYIYALPALFDVSTDPVDPPSYFSARIVRNGTMNPIATFSVAAIERQNEGYPEITGRRYDLAADRVYAVIQALVAEREWPVSNRFGMVGLDEEITIECVARSFWLGLVADVAIRLTDEGDSSYVDIRSSTRYGPHDLGQNARRIQFFLDDLDQSIADLPAAAEAGENETEAEAPDEPPPLPTQAPNE